MKIIEKESNNMTQGHLKKLKIRIVFDFVLIFKKSFFTFK